MAQRFEYRVCAVQNNRVTFVNGEWQGTVAPTTAEPNEALVACPTLWDYLSHAGHGRWELVSAINQPLDNVQLQTVFLKRALPS